MALLTVWWSLKVQFDKLPYWNHEESHTITGSNTQWRLCFCRLDARTTVTFVQATVWNAILRTDCNAPGDRDIQTHSRNTSVPSLLHWSHTGNIYSFYLWCVVLVRRVPKWLVNWELCGRKWSWLSLSILEGLSNTIGEVVLVTQCHEGVEVQFHVSWPRHKLELSGQVPVRTALPPWIKSPVHVG